MHFKAEHQSVRLVESAFAFVWSYAKYYMWVLFHCISTGPNEEKSLNTLSFVPHHGNKMFESYYTNIKM